MNRAVYYFAAVFPAWVRQALSAGTSHCGQGWRSTAASASSGPSCMPTVSQNTIKTRGSYARRCANRDLRIFGPDGAFAELSQLVICEKAL